MKTRFNIWIDKEDVAILKTIGESKGLSISALLRMLVKKYIKEQNKTKQI
jgi:antitoxin component of RelBE/YafQ-DinJ toxin-antitoxin module